MATDEREKKFSCESVQKFYSGEARKEALGDREDSKNAVFALSD